ncbi:MAG: mechanosensitive ion channel family protein [Candidatus Aminicenantes bacterium]|nr:mechanosensitive ion channel family protein [Candidatus Aminicenantes bacterium]
MAAIEKFLENTFYHNTVLQWLLAALILAAVLVLTMILVRLLGRKLMKVAQKTETHADDLIALLIKKTKFFFLLAVSVFCASLFLILPPAFSVVFRKALVIAFLLQGAVWGTTLISFWIDHYVKEKRGGDAAARTTFSALGFILRLVLWSLIVLLGLDNLGVNITALITGLGIGGVAVALAMQNILSDLFASLSIALDKPFVLGDYIVVDSFQGTVEHIGLKTTRVRSLSGEQLIFSNNDLLKSRIRNLERMTERRIVFGLRVSRRTPREKLTAVPVLLREIIGARTDARFDRAHLKELGDFSYDFEVVYWVLSPDYARYMDVQHAINLEIARRFARKGIKLAYPTQAVIVSK